MFVVVWVFTYFFDYMVDFVWVPCLAPLSTTGCVFMLVKNVYFWRFVVPHVAGLLWVSCLGCVVIGAVSTWVGKTVQCPGLNFVYSCGPVGLFDDRAMCWSEFCILLWSRGSFWWLCNVLVCFCLWWSGPNDFKFVYFCLLIEFSISFSFLFWSICRTHNV
jgi:hypothetical protein